MIRKFYEADHGYDNSGPSQPSGGKSAEEILMKHEWLPGGGWTKQNMLAAMEEYASQYAHQQPVQGYSEAEAIVKELAQWSKKYPRSTIYPMTNKQMDEELISIEEKANRFTSQQPVNETTPLELIDALENTMKPIYQQPVNDGWRVYNTGVDITEQCTFESGVITINSDVAKIKVNPDEPRCY